MEEFGFCALIVLKSIAIHLNARYSNQLQAQIRALSDGMDFPQHLRP
jgi:hypothetical protein